MDRSKLTGVCSYCKICSAALARGKYKDSQSTPPENVILATYGITAEMKQDLLKFQGSVCAICGSSTPQSKKTWAIDHNHVTKEIRGVLCNQCNPALGMLKDSKEIMLAMIAYLVDFPARKFFGSPKIMPVSKRIKRIVSN